ncbi:hypothetical protein [Enterococcus mundtii]|uniref:Cell wall protein n=1 Tax=Enterococcus mundtii TaxID=53346 RepID=A0A242KUL2_ENTMU|nr:hypothetical protein [Enterococcus mundtii]OTP24821.1 hypothetical protein A5802_002976 [Enterococcus mundtii]
MRALLIFFLLSAMYLVVSTPELTTAKTINEVGITFFEDSAEGEEPKINDVKEEKNYHNKDNSQANRKYPQTVERTNYFLKIIGIMLTLFAIYKLKKNSPNFYKDYGVLTSNIKGEK